MILLITLSLSILKLARPLFRDIFNYRLQVEAKSLAAMQYSKTLQSDLNREELKQSAQGVLEKNGFSVKINQRNSHILIAAIKGRPNRIGFFLAHVGFIFVCIGLFLDSDILLTRQLNNTAEPSSDSVRKDLSRISLQGEMLLTEGVLNDEFKLTTAKGLLNQLFPFKVSLQGVKFEGGVAGLIDQQTAYLKIYDSRLDAPRDIFISQSQSAQHRGYDFYFESISSKESDLKIRAWPLYRPYIGALKMNTKVGAERELQTARGPITIKFTELKLRNITTEQKQVSSELPFKNVGPKLFFNIAAPGQAQKEYMVYMLPIEQQGRWFYITGVRSENDAAYKYLHIPADPQGNVERFLAFHSLLHDQKQVLATIQKTVSGANTRASKLQQQMINILLDAVTAFNQGGVAAVEKMLAEKIPADKLAPFMQTTSTLLRKVFFQLYNKVIEKEYNQEKAQLSNNDLVFFDDALSAHVGLAAYGLPFYIQLDDFEYRPVVSIKVSRKPGRGLFFFGAVMLLIGLVLMITIRYRRLWVHIEDQDKVRKIIFAGTAYRQNQTFSAEFNALSEQFAQEPGQC